MDVFAAIADRTRRGILERLRREGPLSITEIAERLPVTRQAVTKHLDILERAGLIDRQSRGRERIHSLRAAPLRLLSEWLGPYEAEWDVRLSRLRSHIDGDSDD